MCGPEATLQVYGTTASLHVGNDSMLAMGVATDIAEPAFKIEISLTELVVTMTVGMQDYHMIWLPGGESSGYHMEYKISLYSLRGYSTL